MSSMHTYVVDARIRLRCICLRQLCQSSPSSSPSPGPSPSLTLDTVSQAVVEQLDAKLSESPDWKVSVQCHE